MNWSFQYKMNTMVALKVSSNKSLINPQVLIASPQVKNASTPRFGGGGHPDYIE